MFNDIIKPKLEKDFPHQAFGSQVTVSDRDRIILFSYLGYQNDKKKKKILMFIEPWPVLVAGDCAARTSAPGGRPAHNASDPYGAHHLQEDGPMSLILVCAQPGPMD